MNFTRIIAWIKKKDNYIFVVFLSIGMILASYKYGFLPSLIVFGALIILSYVIGLLIGWFLK